MKKRRDKQLLRRQGQQTGGKHNPPSKAVGYKDGDKRKGVV